MKVRKMRSPLVLLAVLSGALAGSASAATSPVTLDLGTLGGGVSFAFAVNARGHVAGYSYTADVRAYHAVLWQVVANENDVNAEDQR